MTVRDVSVLSPLPEEFSTTWGETAPVANERPTWLLFLVVATFVLNVLDAGFTMAWIELGMATEANPLMAQFIHIPSLFVVVKLALAGMGCTLLWRLREHPLAVGGIVVVFAAYYVLLLHHVSALGEPLASLLL